MTDEYGMPSNEPEVTNQQDIDPKDLLIQAMVFGTSDSVVMGEKQGQIELVNSSLLPTEISRPDTMADFEALGFIFHGIKDGDPMFQRVDLPEGWKKVESDHDMWSYIEDETGKERVAIFYKASFYDRHAHMYLVKDRG